MPHSCYLSQKKRIYDYHEEEYDQESEEGEFVNIDDIDDQVLLWLAENQVWEGN